MQCAIIITHDACNPSRRRCSHADTLSAGSTDLSPSPFSLLRAHITDPLAKMRYPIPAVMIDIVCRGEKRRREPLARSLESLNPQRYIEDSISLGKEGAKGSIFRRSIHERYKRDIWQANTERSKNK